MPIKKDNTDNNEWTILSQKTQAKISRSYLQNGEAKTEQEELFGTPESVKQNTSKKYVGEVSHLEWVHTWTDLERELHENTTNGITKRREVKTVQTYDFGDGESVKTFANPQGTVYKNPEDEKIITGMDKTDYLKNFQDQLDNRVNQQEATNKNNSAIMWVTIVVITAIAVTALVLAVL